MKIIHIASFKGNVGDKINHTGFYKSIKKMFKNIEVTQIEMRDFYFSAKNKRSFDLDFSNYINTFDLCVIGGGAFFDVHWKNSSTGTSLDLSDSFIDSIGIPVVINAIGYHEFDDSDNNTLKKFKCFLKRITSKDNWLVSLRNDGSFERLNKRFNNEFASKVYKVPDNGFVRYVPKKNIINKKNITLGLCITNELFCKSYNKNITEDAFNKEITEFINNIDGKIDRLIFFPHTPQDIKTIDIIIKNIIDSIKRYKLIVAPYDACSEEATERIKNYYQMCDLLIGMRFHSVVTGVSLNIPTITLSSHAQIEALARELKLSEWFIRIDHENIYKELEIMLDKLKSQYSDVIETYKVIMTGIRKSHKEYIDRIYEIIKNRIS